MADCTYCGSDLSSYDPVVITRGRGENGIREGEFCNYGCLSVWLDETDAAIDTCCRIDV